MIIERLPESGKNSILTFPSRLTLSAGLPMTLTETATITKRFLRVFLIFGAAFLVLWIAFLYIYNNIVIPYQRSQIKPERRFGPLPQAKFPSTLLSSASLSYTLDTRSGNLPTDIPKLVNIYFLPAVN